MQIQLTDRAADAIRRLEDKQTITIAYEFTGGCQGLQEFQLHASPGTTPEARAADEDTWHLLEPSPVLDYHPTLKWMLKNKNQTIANNIHLYEQTEA
ncbi:hypothetical protein CHL76_09435 [Marinococcus halophilus]|uniref:FeS cluster biogenesis domain-containing protein n=1 Tax=Marinococcus halophilus TaxID=1371 RepID=A0A510Y4X1_MARHA|nr:hypothetical protein [Marinococcus halophilus]OZT80318.1 hypothetical protein CHL76_09435 [Marinococcus halophilus]GEK58382.1 hypothetical protein MHA01_12870 [Marinococcus halophilus]